ncbi:MAG: ABC transporter permease [Deltaproteobacteria bacterium]|nr:ABC transporter permease [Deltaproteobacteria bacterium]
MNAPRAARTRAILLAALLSAIAFELAVLAWGESPGSILAQLFAGTWGTRFGAGQVLFKATSIALAGAAAQIALRAGLFQIGAEGAIAVSALAVGAIGARLPASVSPIVAWPLLALVAASVGALWTLPIGVLRARFGAHEVISGIMTNKIAGALVGYLLARGLAERASVHTAPLPPGATLVRLGPFPGSAANVAIFVAIAVVVAWAWIARRTVFGREVSAIGASDTVSLATGIAVGRRQIEILALSGAVAGLCALNDVMGYKGYAEEGLSSGVGFTGLAAALLAGRSSVGLLATALFFATLSQGGLSINARIPMEIVDVVVALVILFVAVAPRIDEKLGEEDRA